MPSSDDEVGSDVPLIRRTQSGSSSNAEEALSSAPEDDEPSLSSSAHEAHRSFRRWGNNLLTSAASLVRQSSLKGVSPRPSNVGQTQPLPSVTCAFLPASPPRCSGSRCVRVFAGILGCLFLLLWGSLQLVRSVYPEQAMWIDNVCVARDIWRDTSFKDDGALVNSQRARVFKHHPALDNPVTHALESALYAYKESSFAPGSIEIESDFVVLVGMHHKTGSVLARKLFASMCVRLRQCCDFHVTSGSEHDVRQSLATKGVRLVSHPQWPWFPTQLVDPNQRPYRFIHFWRNPVAKLASGYLYHKTGVERWTTNYKFNADRVCNARQPQEAGAISDVCDTSRICKQCCEQVLVQGGYTNDKNRLFRGRRRQLTAHRRLAAATPYGKAAALLTEYNRSHSEAAASFNRSLSGLGGSSGNGGMSTGSKSANRSAAAADHRHWRRRQQQQQQRRRRTTNTSSATPTQPLRHQKGKHLGGGHSSRSPLELPPNTSPPLAAFPSLAPSRANRKELEDSSSGGSPSSSSSPSSSLLSVFAPATVLEHSSRAQRLACAALRATPSSRRTTTRGAAEAAAAEAAATLRPRRGALNRGKRQGEKSRQAKIRRRINAAATTYTQTRVPAAEAPVATLAGYLREAPLSDGLVFEAAVQFFENYRMAQILNRTRAELEEASAAAAHAKSNGGKSSFKINQKAFWHLHIELDEMMGDFPRVVQRITRFLGLHDGLRSEGGDGVSQGEKRWGALVDDNAEAILRESRTYDMAGKKQEQSVLGELYSALYNSPIYQHNTGSGEEKAVVIAELNQVLCTHALLREAYAPVFDLLAMREGVHPQRPNCAAILAAKK